MKASILKFIPFFSSDEMKLGLSKLNGNVWLHAKQLNVD